MPAPKVPPVVEMTPVPELYEMTDAPESEEEEILLLKFVKSEAARHPLVAVDALSQVIAFTERVSPEEKVRMFS